MQKFIPFAALAVCTTAHAASFNCAKATTPQEKAICASPELSAMDDRMASAYKAALAATPADMADLVRQDQRDWLKLVPLYCPDSSPNELQPMVDCVQQVYKSRTGALLHLILRRAGITFVTRTITRIVHEDDETEVPTQMMPGYGTLSVTWPIAAAANPEWQAWNNAVKKAALEILNSDDTEEASGPHADWSAQPNEDNTIEVKIGTVNAALATALVDGWRLRGAHTSESSIQLNWLLKEHRELQAADVFLPKSRWDSYLQSRCNRFLRSTLDSSEKAGNYETYKANGPKVETLHHIVVDTRNWQLSRSGLAIVFQDYAVAPRAAHPGPVVIPWSDLKVYLNPAFTIPD